MCLCTMILLVLSACLVFAQEELLSANIVDCFEPSVRVPRLDANEDKPASKSRLTYSDVDDQAHMSDNVNIVVREKRVKRKRHQLNRDSVKTNKKRRESSKNDEVKCGNVNCRILPTTGDGHCYYHAIVLSLAYSQHRREAMYPFDVLIDYNLHVIFNDVFVTSNSVSLMYSFPGDSGMTHFEEDVIEIQSLIRKESSDKKTVAIDALKRNKCCENAVSTWETFDEDSPQIMFLYIIMLYRYRPARYCSTLNAVDYFRYLTTVPSVPVIKTIKQSAPSASGDDEPLNKNSICIFQSKEIHFSGLNCTQQNGDIPEPAAEISLHWDNNIHEQINFNEKVNCSESRCKIMPMWSTTSTYYDALLQSYDSFRIRKRLGSAITVKGVLKNAIISMKLLSDTKIFAEEFKKFETSFMVYNTDVNTNFTFVTELQVNNFISVLRDTIELTGNVLNYITTNMENKYLRQYVFSIYTHALNLDFHLDPMAKRIQENIQLTDVNRIVTISDTSRVTGDQYVKHDNGDIVCIYETQVNGLRDNKEIRYFGVDC